MRKATRPAIFKWRQTVPSRITEKVLGLTGRDGLRTLIQVVESGNADFDAILVYDISRWGRFQDADESAYYEYISKRAGVDVHYCAEQFSNDGSSSATLLKTVKRTMAGEYSREHSVKVFAGQSRLIELGFRLASHRPVTVPRRFTDLSRRWLRLCPGPVVNRSAISSWGSSYVPRRYQLD